MKNVIFIFTILLTSCAGIEKSFNEFRDFTNRGFNSSDGLRGIEYGIAKEEVIKKLGKPTNEYSKYGYDYMAYSGGFITLKNNVVIKTDKSPYENEIELKIDSQLRRNFVINNKKIFITSANQKNNNDSIVFDNIRLQIQASLQDKGVSFVNNYKDADAVLVVNLGISDPKINTRRDIVPIFSFDGDKSSKTTVSNQYGNTIGTINTTTPGNGLQVVGSQEVVRQEVRYSKYLVLSLLIDDKQNKQSIMACRVDSITTDSNSDLRLYTPPLLVATLDYLCVDSQTTKTITYKPNDIRINVALFGIIDEI